MLIPKSSALFSRVHAEYFYSAQLSCSAVSSFLQPHGLQQAARQSFLSITNPQSMLKLMSIKSVMHAIILSSVISFSSCPQSFPASESFPMSQLFTSGGQSTGVSASAPVLPVNIQDSFPLGLIGWISLQSKGLSRVFSNATVQKH